MKGTSLGGGLVLVSACLTVSPLITGGQAHTHIRHPSKVSNKSCKPNRQRYCCPANRAYPNSCRVPMHTLPRTTSAAIPTTYQTYQRRSGTRVEKLWQLCGVGGRVKTITSRSQCIVPMLPQQTVQPKNKEACTAAPLQNREHGGNAFIPGDDKDNCFIKPASFMVTADHDPRRDDGGPLGQRFCWSGWEVVGNHPEPTRRTPMRRNTGTAGEGVSGAVGPAGQTSNQSRCAVSSTGLLWRRGVAGFAMPGIDGWSVVDTNIGAQGQQH